MSSTTPTLRLVLTGTSEEDKNILFETWRSQMSGEDGASNMQIIDQAIAEDRSRITAIEENGVLADGYAQSVNDIPPDKNGNIALTAKDVGALFINKEGAIEGAPAPVNADMLGGIAADQYAKKSDISVLAEGVPPGGGSGQILAKTSDADYDTQWIDPPAAEQTPEYGGDANTLGGKTLEEIKTEIKNEISSAEDGDADTIAGKTLEEIKNEIKTDILENSQIDADTLGGKTLSEIKSELESSGDIDADTMNGMTFDQLKAAILAEVVYQ